MATFNVTTPNGVVEQEAENEQSAVRLARNADGLSMRGRYSATKGIGGYFITPTECPEVVAE